MAQWHRPGAEVSTSIDYEQLSAAIRNRRPFTIPFSTTVDSDNHESMNHERLYSSKAPNNEPLQI